MTRARTGQKNASARNEPNGGKAQEHAGKPVEERKDRRQLGRNAPVAGRLGR